jgi:Family of unknown function (DUF5824)
MKFYQIKDAYLVNPDDAIPPEYKQKGGLPRRYVPRSLTRKDRIKVLRSLQKSRRMYRTQRFISRPKVKSFRSRKSSHIERAKRKFHVNSIRPSQELARKSGCSLQTLKAIVKKGEGAYYSSGSRPNQTAQSWGIARLASALTGGPASHVDRHLLVSGCKSSTLSRM